jgi:thiosulfate reductase cytochrome b subunit
VYTVGPSGVDAAHWTIRRPSSVIGLSANRDYVILTQQRDNNNDRRLMYIYMIQILIYFHIIIYYLWLYVLRTIFVCNPQPRKQL